MPSHRLFVSSFAIISVLSVALPVVADELTPQQIYERAAPAVVLVIGHSEEGGNGSGGAGSLIWGGGGGLSQGPVVLEGKKKKAGHPLSRLLVRRAAPGLAGADHRREHRHRPTGSRWPADHQHQLRPQVERGQDMAPEPGGAGGLCVRPSGATGTAACTYPGADSSDAG